MCQAQTGGLLYNGGMNGHPFITSRDNPLVKQARALRQRKKRLETGLFLVEGIHHVGEAVEAGWLVETLIYAPDLLKSGFANQLVSEQSKRGLNCHPVSVQVMELLAEKDNPQGILAIVRQKLWRLADLNTQKFRWGVAVVSVQDPGNIGAILRTIDAVGADGLILLEGGTDPYHPTAVRASMGTLFWKPVVAASFIEFIHWAHAQGYWLVGSSAHAATDYRSIRFGDRPAILVLGSEQKGLASEQMSACDILVALPMRGRATSLNLAVAAGVLLYAFIADER